MADEKQGDVNEPEETAAAPEEEPTAQAEQPAEQAEEPTAQAEEPAAQAEEPAAEAEEPAEHPAAEAEQPAEQAEEPAEQAEEPAAEAEEPAEQPAAEAEQPATPEPAAEAPEVRVEGDEVLTEEDLDEIVEERPREKPAIPGADLEVDIVREGDDVLRGESRWDEDLEDEVTGDAADAEDLEPQPIADAAIDLAAGARYTATGKRKTAVARVILKPGTGAYVINGRTLEQHFPRNTLQRTIRQPLETVGYESRMDVVASMHGGGVSAQAGALRHGISRALIEADPNLRSELKRRGFLTRDARVKERKKAGLKKARKRPQFSKR
jgi:small subunit ribosomal protein S9